MRSTLPALVLPLLLVVAEQTAAFHLLPSLPTAPQWAPSARRHHQHRAPLSTLRRMPLLLQSASSSSFSGAEGAGTGAATSAGSIDFSDDWKRMVEEGIPIDLGDFEEVPGIMAKPSSPADARPRANEYGVVFPGAFEEQEQPFIRAFKPTRRGRDAELPSVRAGEWWRMPPEAQRAWLEDRRREQQLRADGDGSDSGGAAVATTGKAAVAFKLQGRVLGATRVRYDGARGRFALAETPFLERTLLQPLPALLRYPLTLARPVYAPLFCLRWLGLRSMVLLRALRQFILPSWPYLLLFTARAAYLLAACMLLTVLVDELLQPIAQGLYKSVLALTGKEGAVLPDFRGYSLRPGAVGEKKHAARTWVERWSEPLVTGTGTAAGVGGG